MTITVASTYSCQLATRATRHRARNATFSNPNHTTEL